MAPCAACGVVGGGGAAPPSKVLPHTPLIAIFARRSPRVRICPYSSIGVDCENDTGKPITLIRKIDLSLGGTIEGELGV